MFVHLRFVHLVDLVCGALRRFAVFDVSRRLSPDSRRSSVTECGRVGRGRQLELLV